MNMYFKIYHYIKQLNKTMQIRRYFVQTKPDIIYIQEDLNNKLQLLNHHTNTHIIKWLLTTGY